MSNIKKYCLYTVIYNVGYMFCTGSIVQTFLLHIGLSDRQVYLFTSVTLMAQVLMMLVMTFLSSRLRKIKLIGGISYLSFVLMATTFLLLTIWPSLMGKTFTVIIFIVSAISYVGVGLYNVVAYILPYHTIDMADYGKMVGISTALAGGMSFLFSFIYTYVISKIEYMRAMTIFFLFAILCFITTSVTVLSMKEIKKQDPGKKTTKADLVAVFKNPDTYLLLIPNFARGIAGGVITVIAVIGISTKIIDVSTSAWVNAAMQVGLFLGNAVYVGSCKKLSSGTLLIISTLGVCASLPFCVSGGAIMFFAVFTVAYFFRMMNDTAIPVVVSEIIPEEQIGAFTSIRLLVMTGAQSVSALIITPIASAVGYTGLLIFAAVMQALCGLPYYVIYRSKKKQSLKVSEEK